MRFIENGPILPDELLEAHDEGRVVFFCGAGVSMAYAKLPSFVGLAEQVLSGLGTGKDNEARKLFRISTDLDKKHKLKGVLSADLIFSRLARNFTPKDINCEVAGAVKPPKHANLTAHKILLKLARSASGQTKLVTTNFDLLFEDASKGALDSRTRSNLPRIEYSSNDWGIVHLHGMVNPDYTSPSADGFVLSSAEFGEAYLAHGWARNFVRSILDRYVAVFVGYSADDPPVRYLLEGLRSSGGFNHKLYAFQSSSVGDAIVQWEEKGVIPITHDTYDALWETLDHWGARSVNPGAWKKKLLRKAQKGPVAMKAHERGMIAHLIKTKEGAKLFAEQTPPISSEWLCVFDRKVRLQDTERIFSPNKKSISPYSFYSLDDDPAPASKNENYKPLPNDAWDAFLLNRNDREEANERNYSYLTGHFAQTPSDLVPRLHYLAQWIGRVSNQKITIWWAGLQGGLHQALISKVNYAIKEGEQKSLAKKLYSMWTTVFEVAISSARLNSDEFQFKKSIQLYGWNTSTLRDYIKLSTPYLVRDNLVWRIPRDRREKIYPWDLFKANVKYPEYIFDIKIPDKYLSQAVEGLRYSIQTAVDLELEHSGWIDLCSIEPDFDIKGQSYEREGGLSGYTLHFVGLFRALMSYDINLAKREYQSWRYDEIFSRLRIWACGQAGVSSANEFANEILSIPNEYFWTYKGQRDLLLCLKSNWDRLSLSDKVLVEKKIKRGPYKLRSVSANENKSRAASLILDRFHWLSRQGCKLSFDLDDLTKELTKFAPDWKSEYSNGAASSRDGRSGWVRTDTTSTSLMDIPLIDVISRAKSISGRSQTEFVEYSPFKGLCDARPVRALGALTLQLKSGQVSIEFWNIFLSSEGRKNDRERLIKLISARILMIPDHEFRKILLGASRWFEDVGPTILSIAPALFSLVWNKFIKVISANEEDAASSLVRSKDNGIDWVAEAINSPSGNLAELLLTDPAVKKLKQGEGYPNDWLARANSLLALPGDSSRYALVILSHSLLWLYYIEPKWTEAVILSKLSGGAVYQLDGDAVWAGFLWGARLPRYNLFMLLKTRMINAIKEKELNRRGHLEVLSGLALGGWAAREGKKRYITDDEFRELLTISSEEFRGQVLWHLESWSRDEKAWGDKVAPFLINAWPKDKKIRTAKISARLCDLALAQGRRFPKISKLVTSLAAQIDDEFFFLPEMRKSGDGLAANYPEELLGLLHTVLPDNSEKWPYGVREALKCIEVAKPALLKDPRLCDLKSRLGDV